MKNAVQTWVAERQHVRPFPQLFVIDRVECSEHFGVKLSGSNGRLVRAMVTTRKGQNGMQNEVKKKLQMLL